MKIPDQSDSFSLADLIITPVVAGALSGFGLLFPEICSFLEPFGILVALDVAERALEDHRT